jgi:hypothetical protein
MTQPVRTVTIGRDAGGLSPRSITGKQVSPASDPLITCPAGKATVRSGKKKIEPAVKDGRSHAEERSGIRDDGQLRPLFPRDLAGGRSMQKLFFAEWLGGPQPPVR